MGRQKGKVKEGGKGGGKTERKSKEGGKGGGKTERNRGKKGRELGSQKVKREGRREYGRDSCKVVNYVKVMKERECRV